MRPLLFVLCLASLAACSDTLEKSTGPAYDALAAAKADGAIIVGALAFTAPADGNLAKATPRQTWTLDVRPGAVVDLEITHAGTTAALDTVLTVVGPAATDAATTPVVATDDDSGWGLHSRLKGLALTGGGRYLVTVASYDGKQKGKYRLVTTCRSGDCAPLPAGGLPRDERYCHPLLLVDIERCVDEQLADADRDPATYTALDVGRACADAEPLGDAHDAICASERPAPTWCGLEYEAFMNSAASLCADQGVSYAMRRECALGAGFRDLRAGALRGVVVTHERLLTAASTLTALEREQLLAAVRVAYDDAADVAAAFDDVDGGEVNQLHVWDATGNRGFVAYEYGAGDNSYGAVIAEGGTTIAARIQDGDYYDCVAPGPELAACTKDGDCASGLRCLGLTEGQGVCSSNPRPAGDGESCLASIGCAVASGLVCASVDTTGHGLCQPVWMQGRFEDWAVVGIPAHGKVTRTLTAYGLTTVSTDVTLRLTADHPTPGDLKVTLANPLGTTGVAWDHETGSLELVRPVRAYPGDEPANGPWVLTIENTGGQTGTLVSWGLDVMSRWD